jgi:hypothetical protein
MQIPRLRLPIDGTADCSHPGAICVHASERAHSGPRFPFAVALFARALAFAGCVRTTSFLIACGRTLCYMEITQPCRIQKIQRLKRRRYHAAQWNRQRDELPVRIQSDPERIFFVRSSRRESEVARMSLANEKIRAFPHRKNNNGTIDSICPVCFVTVHTAEREEELASFERAHTCDPVVLAIRKKRLPGIDVSCQHSTLKAG